MRMEGWLRYGQEALTDKRRGTVFGIEVRHIAVVEGPNYYYGCISTFVSESGLFVGHSYVPFLWGLSVAIPWGGGAFV